jgi:hypothetical protein
MKVSGCYWLSNVVTINGLYLLMNLLGKQIAIIVLLQLISVSH